MHVFFCWCFSGRLPIGMAHFKPLKGGNARQFVVGCLPTAIPDLLLLKQGEMLVIFFVGVYWFPFGSKMDLSDAKLD